VLATILKNGDVDARRQRADPRGDPARSSAAEGSAGKIQVKMLFDQSIFVRASIDGVVREALSPR
jgi:hypothetical protein